MQRSTPDDGAQPRDGRAGGDLDRRARDRARRRRRRASTLIGVRATYVVAGALGLAGTLRAGLAAAPERGRRVDRAVKVQKGLATFVTTCRGSQRATAANPTLAAGRAAGGRLDRDGLPRRHRRRPRVARPARAGGARDRRARLRAGRAGPRPAPRHHDADGRRSCVPSLDEPAHGRGVPASCTARSGARARPCCCTSRTTSRDAERARRRRAAARRTPGPWSCRAARGLGADSMQLLRRRDVRVVYFGDRPPDVSADVGRRRRPRRRRGC